MYWGMQGMHGADLQHSGCVGQGLNCGFCLRELLWGHPAPHTAAFRANDNKHLGHSVLHHPPVPHCPPCAPAPQCPPSASVPPPCCSAPLCSGFVPVPPCLTAGLAPPGHLEVGGGSGEGAVCCWRERKKRRRREAKEGGGSVPPPTPCRGGGGRAAAGGGSGPPGGRRGRRRTDGAERPELRARPEPHRARQVSSGQREGGAPNRDLPA